MLMFCVLHDMSSCWSGTFNDWRSNLGNFTVHGILLTYFSLKSTPGASVSYMYCCMSDGPWTCGHLNSCRLTLALVNPSMPLYIVCGAPVHIISGSFRKAPPGDSLPFIKLLLFFVFFWRRTSGCLFFGETVCSVVLLTFKNSLLPEHYAALPSNRCGWIIHWVPQWLNNFLRVGTAMLCMC